MKQELEYQADDGLSIQTISNYFINQCAKMQSILVNNEHQKHIWISAQETLKKTQAKCFAYFSARG